MKLILIFLISSMCMAQTYVETRGGAILNEFGGNITVGFTQHVDDVVVSGLFNGYTIGYESFDSYDVEVGYLMGNHEGLSIYPVLGVGWDNNRSWTDFKDKVALFGGVSLMVDVEGHKMMVGYRNRGYLSTLFIGIKLRFRPSKQKHRFF
ncbi:MAG: hypothetical protein KAS32_09415 [Candidatus Peribacteraceae bacterium]|nr:hypothetical protein [Candidatus Peribacteraceae bacterium]